MSKVFPKISHKDDALTFTTIAQMCRCPNRTRFPHSDNQIMQAEITSCPNDLDEITDIFKSDLKDPLNQTSIHQNPYCYINPQVIVMRRFPFTWSCSSCQSWEYESTPAERMKISWEETERTEPSEVRMLRCLWRRKRRSESAWTSVTWNVLNSTNEAVIALEQFPTVKQWQAPGTSRGGTDTDWRRSSPQRHLRLLERSETKALWRRRDEHSAPKPPPGSLRGDRERERGEKRTERERERAREKRERERKSRERERCVERERERRPRERRRARERERERERQRREERKREERIER